MSCKNEAEAEGKALEPATRTTLAQADAGPRCTREGCTARVNQATGRCTAGHAQEPEGDDLFTGADLLYATTRASLLEDGYLIDVTEQAREQGFRWPVAVSRAVWDMVKDIPPPFQREQTVEARLRDVLLVAAIRARIAVGAKQEPPFYYKMTLYNSDSTDWDTWVEGEDKSVGKVVLKITIDYAAPDDPQPCYTISLPDED